MGREIFASFEQTQRRERVLLRRPLFAVEGHDEADGLCAVGAEESERLGGGRAGGEYIVDDDDALAVRVGADEHAALAVVLDLLAVEAPGNVAVVAAGEGHGRGAHEGDALVGRPEEEIEVEPCGEQAFRVELAECGEIRAAVECGEIEEVGALASRFEREAAEAERPALENQTDETFGGVHAGDCNGRPPAPSAVVLSR